MTYQRIKRSFDITLASFLLVALAPVLLVVGLFVRVRLGTPVLFSQVRPGKDGEPFTLYKFRTMTDERDAQDKLLSDAERLTSFGSFLRSSSLDELPELWNILRGDMSFVGPRPLLMKYLPLYSPTQTRRHEVLPGLTGLAQVSGRNQMSWDDKFDSDVWYVDNATMWLDLKIIVRTAVAVLRRDGISSEGEATAPEFTG